MKNPKIVGFAVTGAEGITFTVRGEDAAGQIETCTLEFKEFEDVGGFDQSLISGTQSVMPQEYAERKIKERMEKAKSLLGGLLVGGAAPTERMPHIGFNFDPNKKPN